MSQSKRKYYFPCALFSFLYNLLHLAAGTEDKESKVKKGNQTMATQWKVETIHLHDNKRFPLLTH